MKILKTKSESSGSVAAVRGRSFFGGMLLAGILVASPLLIAVQAWLKYQTIQPVFPMRLRWIFHRRMLNQSLSFFQDEFAGRTLPIHGQAGDVRRRADLDGHQAAGRVVPVALIGYSRKEEHPAAAQTRRYWESTP